MNEGITLKSPLWPLFPTLCVAFGILLATVFPPNSTRPPVPHIPTKIDVNGTNWRIEVVEEIGAGLIGWTDCSKRLISLKRVAKDRHDILIHELTHATVCGDATFGFQAQNMYFNSTTSQDHEGVYRFADVWSELLTRNPDLAAYLGSKE